MRNRFAPWIAALAAALLAGCGRQQPVTTPAPGAPAPSDGLGSIGMTVPGAPAPSGGSRVAAATGVGEEVTTASGLTYETLGEGDGEQAGFGDRVRVHYTATIEGGDRYDSSRERGEPWVFTIGDDRATQGFNEGVAGMRVGELRRLIVPSNLAYGALGTFAEYKPGQPRGLEGALQLEEPPSIPPNSTILYEVELLGIEPPDADEPASGADAAESGEDAPTSGDGSSGS